MIIRLDKHFIEALKQAGYDVNCQTLKKIYADSRKEAERQFQENLKKQNKGQMELF